MSKSANISRRNLVKGAALGAAAIAAASGVSVAGAAESTETQWDEEYDVIVLGMGFAGMAAATAAAKQGANVLICEKAPESLAGGNSRVCGQCFLYTAGDTETPTTYFTAMAAGRDLPEDMLQTYAEGIANSRESIADLYELNPDDFTTFDYHTTFPDLPSSEPFATLWQAHDSEGSRLFEAARDYIASGKAGSIEVRYETPGVALVQDQQDKTVLGVTVEQNGAQSNIRATSGVVVATGGFENNQQMQQTYLNLVDAGPEGTVYNTGDGIKMCQAVGADLWHMNIWASEGGLNCGYYAEDATLTSFSGDEAKNGASIIVGGWGNRFADETGYLGYGMKSDNNGVAYTVQLPPTVWAVLDQTQVDAIDAAGTLTDDLRNQYQQCASIEEAADIIGCEADNLSATIESFNEHADAGTTDEFGRDPETTRAFDGEAYYVVRLKPQVAWTLGGPRRDAQCRVIDLDGNPIPHLYSAGEMGNVFVCTYQSGGSVSDCHIFGPIAGESAAASK